MRYTWERRRFLRMRDANDARRAPENRGGLPEHVTSCLRTSHPAHAWWEWRNAGDVAACTPAAETQNHGFPKDGHLPGGRIVGWQFAVQKPIHWLGVVAMVLRNITRGLPQALQPSSRVPA